MISFGQWGNPIAERHHRVVHLAPIHGFTSIREIRRSVSFIEKFFVNELIRALESPEWVLKTTRER